MRTDVHKPSSIMPDEYVYVAEDYMKVEDLGSALILKEQREIIAEHRARTGGTYAQVDTTGNCMVCGSVNALYTSIFWHQPSNTYVRMGHDCADKCHTGGETERNAFRRKLEDVREAQKGKLKAKAILADAGLSTAYGIYAADYDSLPRDPKTARAARPATENDPEDIPAYAGNLYYEEQTIRDIVGKLVKYGSITAPTMVLLETLTKRIPGRDQRNAEWEAKKAADKAAAKPAPTGRVKIEGTVLKVEDRETQFGMVKKMTVKTTDGWIAWGSVPSNAVVEKDCRIVFVATVTPSENDEKFAFFRRPVLYLSPEEKKEHKRARLLEQSQQEGTVAPTPEV